MASPPTSPGPAAGVQDLKSRFEALATASSSSSAVPSSSRGPKPTALGPSRNVSSASSAALEKTPSSERPSPRFSAIPLHSTGRTRSVSSPPASPRIVLSESELGGPSLSRTRSALGHHVSSDEHAAGAASTELPASSEDGMLAPGTSNPSSRPTSPLSSPALGRYRPVTPYETRPPPPPSPKLTTNAPPVTAKRKPPPPPPPPPHRGASRTVSGGSTGPTLLGSEAATPSSSAFSSRATSPHRLSNGRDVPPPPPPPPPRLRRATDAPFRGTDLHSSPTDIHPPSRSISQAGLNEVAVPRQVLLTRASSGHAMSRGFSEPLPSDPVPAKAPPVPARPPSSSLSSSPSDPDLMRPPPLPHRKPSVPGLSSRLAPPDEGTDSPPPPPRRPGPPPAPPHPPSRARSPSTLPRDIPHPPARIPSASLDSSLPSAPPLPERARAPPPVFGPRDPPDERPSSAPPSHPRNLGPDDPFSGMPRPPPTRNVPLGAPIQARKPSGGSGPPSIGGGPGGADDSDEEDDEPGAANGYVPKPDDMPDSTFANRRPPDLDPPVSLHIGQQYTAFAIRGRHLCTAHHHVKLWDAMSGEVLGTANPTQEVKIVAMEFKGSFEGTDGPRPQYVWCGTKDGQLFEYDCANRRITDHRQNLHSTPVVGVFRTTKGGMLTLDESGKAQIWTGGEGVTVKLSSSPRAQRIVDKTSWSCMIAHQLWTSSGPSSAKHAGSMNQRSPAIRVYDPNPSQAWTVTPRPMHVPESAGAVGAVSAGTILPSHPEQVYLAHESGHVSVWTKDGTQFSCVQVLKISNFHITALEGVTKNLWAGYRSGEVYVYNVETTPWQVLKVWKAHKEPVTRICVDPSLLWDDESGRLHVATTGADWTVHIWDGFMGADWRAGEMKKREAEYCTYRSLRVLICSWNVDANRPSDLTGSKDNVNFLSDVLGSVDSPDVVVFGFQEMIDLENKKLTAKSMLLGGRKNRADKLSDHVSQAYRQWLDKLTSAVRLVMPADDPYVVVHTENLVGLFSCVFVKSSERQSMRDVAITTVKTGMKGRYGNKGAIVARLVVDDTSICFINCHLAAGQKHVRQRNANLIDILEEKSAFPDPASPASSSAYRGGGNGSSVLDHEVCFVQGDLNYRIDQRREDVIKSVAMGNYLWLLEHDQLNKERNMNQACRLRTFVEAPITFWPTYKYDPGTEMYDSSEKNRIPAWCDRILYRAETDLLPSTTTSPLPPAVEPLSYRRYECNVSDHRPISGGFSVRVKSIAHGLRRNVWLEVDGRWRGYEQEVKRQAMGYFADL